MLRFGPLLVRGCIAVCSVIFCIADFDTPDLFVVASIIVSWLLGLHAMAPVELVYHAMHGSKAES